jgi:hypothetical protein
VTDQCPHLERWQSFLPNGADPHTLDGQLMGAAFTASSAARREHLAELIVKLLDVGDLEWLAAHGLTYGDRHTAAGRAIGGPSYRRAELSEPDDPASKGNKKRGI